MFRYLPTPLPVLAGLVCLVPMALACATPGPQPAPPTPTDVVSIQTTGCETDYVSIVVDPWTAYVRRGQPVQWTTPASVDSVAIEPVHADLWPFEWEVPADRPDARQRQPAPRRVAPGGQPIEAGTVPETALPGQRFNYRILLYCGARTLDIDPDFIIFF